MTDIRAYANADHALVVWRPGRLTATSRGFAIERRYVDDAGAAMGDPVPLENWTGWEGVKVPPGTFKPSTEWPIQRLMWADFFIAPGKPAQYRAVPLNGAKGALKRGRASAWSETVVVEPAAGRGIEAYFNRGIVASQWVSRRLDDDIGRKLHTRVETVGDPVRDGLSGALRPAMLRLLDAARDDGVDVYAALFELGDPELLPALARLGRKAHVVLANGAGQDGKPRDENADALAELGGVDLHRRMVKQSAYLAHNKFLVVCDKKGKPAAAWTGSTNWTTTGLCTQVNNG